MTHGQRHLVPIPCFSITKRKLPLLIQHLFILKFYINLKSVLVYIFIR